jgi:hypothetical protein
MEASYIQYNTYVRVRIIRFGQQTAGLDSENPDAQFPILHSTVEYRKARDVPILSIHRSPFYTDYLID